MEKQRDDKGRFVKGHTGNPNGRMPKEREIKFYDLTLSAVSENDWTDIVLAAVKLAKRGDAQARKWLSDYLLGLPSQSLELSGKNSGPIELVVRYAKKEIKPTGE